MDKLDRRLVEDYTAVGNKEVVRWIVSDRGLDPEVVVITMARENLKKAKWLSNILDAKSHIMKTAASKGDEKAISGLLKIGYEADNMAMKIAAMHGYVGAVKRLLGRGADPNFHNILIKSIKNRRTNVVRTLIDNGADIHLSGELPLIVSIQKGLPLICERLLDKGAIPYKPDMTHSPIDEVIKRYERGPEHLREQTEELIKTLLKYVDKMHLTTILKKAIDKDCTFMVNILKDHYEVTLK